MADDNWYYTMAGQQQGPVPLEHLKAWLRGGQLQPTELVWREGMPTWIAANTVPELQGIAAAPVAAAAGFAQPVGYAPAGGFADQAAIKAQKSKATTSLVLGIIGLLCFGFILGIIAIVYANQAMKAMKQSGSEEGKGMAIAGMVLGVIDIIGHLGILAFRFS